MIRIARCCGGLLYRLKWLAPVLALLLCAGQAAAQNLVLNPSFETGSLGPWVRLSSGDTVDWIVTANPSAILDGSWGSASTGTNPGSVLIYQDITLPTTGSYSIVASVGCGVKGGLATEFCRADITDTSPETVVLPVSGTDTLATTATGVLVNFFSYASSATNVPIADTAVATLNGTAGQVVRIRFMTSLPSNSDWMAVDNVRLTASAPPVVAGPTPVPTLSQWGLILVALLMAGIVVAEHRRRRDARR